MQSHTERFDRLTDLLSVFDFNPNQILLALQGGFYNYLIFI